MDRSSAARVPVNGNPDLCKPGEHTWEPYYVRGVLQSGKVCVTCWRVRGCTWPQCNCDFECPGEWITQYAQIVAPVARRACTHLFVLRRCPDCLAALEASPFYKWRTARAAAAAGSVG